MRVVMLGGLGNQLFQMSYGHIGIQKQDKLRIYRDVHAKTNRPFNVDPLISGGACAHSIDMGFIASFFIDYRIRLIRKIIHKNLSYLIPFAQKVLKTNYQITPFDYADLKSTQSKSSQVSYGYFEHWKYVEEAWSTFGIELSAALSKIDLPEIITENISKSVVIHVRQGDYRALESTFGVLADSYYENVISTIKNQFGDRQLIVVTDDLLGAKDTLKSIRVDKFIGPDDLGAWETLKLMTISPILVTANSTLSWWGAYIANKSGSTVFLPKPWFKNLHDWPGNAFYFPEAQLVASKFI